MRLDDPNATLNTAAICDRLKQVRVQVCGARGQSHFAALLQLSPSTYNYYEKGRVPPVDVLDRASRVTGAPLLWLIRGEPTDFALESLRKIEPTAETLGSESVEPAASMNGAMAPGTTS
jgi:transcriptional regulator with XRE-family HTH domain